MPQTDNPTMDENAINRSSISWTSPDHRTPAKRRKLEPSNSSSLNNTSNCDCDCDCRRLKTQLVTIRNRLSQSEITAIRLHKVRRELEEIFEREKFVLQMQVVSDSQVIEQLRVDLEAATMSAHGAREAQVSTESEMSQLKTRMEQQISELSVEIARLKEPIPSKSEGTLASSDAITCYQLSRAKKLEEQLQYWKNIVSNLSETVKQKLKDGEMIEQQLKILQDKCEELSSKDSSAASKYLISRYQQTESIPMEDEEVRSRVDALERKIEAAMTMEVGGMGHIEEINSEEPDVQLIKDDCPDAAANEEIPWQVSANDEYLSHDPPSEIDEDCVEIVKEGPRNPILLIDVGNNYFVLPSDPKFFGINWANEYTHEESYTYACKRCPEIALSKTKIEDHVWVVHYGGNFKCPTCYLHHPASLASRNSIRHHVKEFHPHLFESRESNQFLKQ